jgi:hypothetical protein
MGRDMTEHLARTWRKASYSSGSGACVEVAVFHDGAIGIRDSKRPETNLTLSPSAWSSFLTHTKHGAFDR